MKVRELIDILVDLDEEAEVFIMSQQQWPFENALHGVTTRGDISEAVADVDREDGELPKGTATTDVFLVEGTQLRYGSKDAWDAAVRR